MWTVCRNTESFSLRPYDGISKSEHSPPCKTMPSIGGLVGTELRHQAAIRLRPGHQPSFCCPAIGAIPCSASVCSTHQHHYQFQRGLWWAPPHGSAPLRIRTSPWTSPALNGLIRTFRRCFFLLDLSPKIACHAFRLCRHRRSNTLLLASELPCWPFHKGPLSSESLVSRFSFECSFVCMRVRIFVQGFLA